MTGPKISSCAMAAAGSTPSITVGREVRALGQADVLRRRTPPHDLSLRVCSDHRLHPPLLLARDQWTKFLVLHAGTDGHLPEALRDEVQQRVVDRVVHKQARSRRAGL